MAASARADAQTLTIWDAETEPLESNGVVYRWNGYRELGSIKSVLQYVELHADRLRSKYLAWVFELGERMVDGRSLIERFEIEKGLSYWWLTLFAEKSFYKSPIADAIRLLAVDEIVTAYKPERLTLVSANRTLHLALKELCRNAEIDYQWERLRATYTLVGAYRRLPQRIQAIISLARELRGRWPLRKTKRSQWFAGDQAVFLCSYFDNVNSAAAESGRFESSYWADLHLLLSQMGLKGNWLHLFVPSNDIPTAAHAKRWVEGFNQRSAEQGSHAFIESFLSWQVMLAVLKRWVALGRLAPGPDTIRAFFRPAGCRVSLWPLMQRDWASSFAGPVAIHNLLSLELIDAALADIPRQRQGLFLWENQAWERAFVHAWRKHGHGRLAAVAHSTVRFWDLRYFNDPRSLQPSATQRPPEADILVLNSRGAIESLVLSGYPRDLVVEGEALRYGHLNGVRHVAPAKGLESSPIRLLILSDYASSSLPTLLNVLTEALQSSGAHVVTTIKAHPNCPVNPEEFPLLSLRVTNEPVSTLVNDFDVAYSGNVTSAAMDVHVAGLPVVVLRDSGELNYSPLRGRPGVRFVDTSAELAEALEGVFEPVSDAGDLFFLDPALPRWSRLLAG